MLRPPTERRLRPFADALGHGRTRFIGDVGDSHSLHIKRPLLPGPLRRATLGGAMLTLNRPSTALIAVSVTQPIGVMDVARTLGIDAPTALSIVGFGDVEMSTCARVANVRRPFEESGRRATEIPIDSTQSRHQIEVRSAERCPWNSS